MQFSTPVMVECYDSNYLNNKLIGVSRRVEIDWKLALECNYEVS
jgi:hypothetical protein